MKKALVIIVIVLVVLALDVIKDRMIEMAKQFREIEFRPLLNKEAEID